MRRRSFKRWVSFAFLPTAGVVLVAACSSSSHPPNAGDAVGGPVTGGSTQDGSVSDGGDASPGDASVSTISCVFQDASSGCNSLGFCTGPITVVENKAAPPTSLAGGPLPSGLYALTSYVLFTGGDAGGTVIPGSYFRETMFFSTPAGTDAGGDGGSDSGTDASTDSGTGGTALDWQNYVATNSMVNPVAETGQVIFSGTSIVVNEACPTMGNNIFSGQYQTSGNTMSWLTKDTQGVSLLTYTKVN